LEVQSKNEQAERKSEGGLSRRGSAEFCGIEVLYAHASCLDRRGNVEPQH
jgi:hypothetical protein